MQSTRDTLCTLTVTFDAVLDPPFYFTWQI